MCSSIHIVKSEKDVTEISDFAYMFSGFSSQPNIGTNELAALLRGDALVDMSDGEYVHWLQLTDEARSKLPELLTHI